MGGGSGAALRSLAPARLSRAPAMRGAHVALIIVVTFGGCLEATAQQSACGEVVSTMQCDNGMGGWGVVSNTSCIPEYATPSCTLLSGPGSYCLQLLLLILGFSSLYAKKLLEDRRTGTTRDIKVWMLDASKQGFSGAAAHICGLINASILNEHSCFDAGDDDARATDDCGWYFMTFSMDSTVGVLFAYILHKALSRIAAGFTIRLPLCWSGLRIRVPPCTSLSRSGDYRVGDEVNYGIWGRQMAAWCTVTILARAIVLGEFLHAFYRRQPAQLCPLLRDQVQSCSSSISSSWWCRC